MLLTLCFVCFFGTLGGVLLGQSLKGMLIFKEGLEKGLRKMFIIGLAALALAVILSLLAYFIPLR